MRRIVMCMCIIYLAMSLFGASSSPELHERFQKLQRLPFLRGDRQFFLLNGIVYFRNYGEKKFRRAPQFKTQAALDNFHHSCSSSPFDASSFLEKEYVDPPPGLNDKAPYVLFEEGFESGMSAWTLGNDGIPDVDWDPVTCRKHTYSYSAYCVGGGPDSPGDCTHEAWGADNHMIAGVNVTNMPSIYLEYYRWADLEFRRSNIAVEAGFDIVYFPIDFFSGDSLGWQVRRIYM